MPAQHNCTFVSICRADHWLPEDTESRDLIKSVILFQSAAQITGSLKPPAGRRRARYFCFNLPRRSLAP